MPDCCDPAPYQDLFDSKEARRSVRNYRRKGLDPMASSMVEFLDSRGVAGLDLLEVGGGIGAVEVELLKRGVTRAVNVELSTGYDAAAAELAESESVADRIERRIGDFVDIHGEMASADIVLANRVLCCYPWMERLMGAFVSRTARYLALVFPRERWWVKLGLRIGELFLRVRGCGFRAFVHPVAEIERIAASAGLVVRHRDRTAMWQAVVWERVA